MSQPELYFFRYRQDYAVLPSRPNRSRRRWKTFAVCLADPANWPTTMIFMMWKTWRLKRDRRLAKTIELRTTMQQILQAVKPILRIVQLTHPVKIRNRWFIILFMTVFASGSTISACLHTGSGCHNPCSSSCMFYLN